MTKNFIPTIKISIAMHPLIKRAFGSQIYLSVAIFVDSPVVPLMIAVVFVHFNKAFCITFAK